MKRWHRGGLLISVALTVSGLGVGPAAGQDPGYLLPAPAGTQLVVTQGNDTGAVDGDHRGTSTFAYDFAVAGNPSFRVAASRAGVVQAVRSDVPDGNCPFTGQVEAPPCWTDVNYAIIDHGDGTAALYMHLAEDSASGLSPGDPVERGDIIGTAGNSGWSSANHLHFMVMTDVPAGSSTPWWRESLGPIAFADRSVRAARPDGVPSDGVRNDGPFVSDNVTPDAPSGVAPPVQWIEPVDGADVGPSLRLVAWPTPILVDGRLTDPTDVARVDFRATWSGGDATACSVTTAGSDGTWACTADLPAMGVPAGPVTLTFDVERTDGTTLSAPDGRQAVVFGGGSTKVVWVKRGTTSDASHVRYGEPVKLVTRFHGDVDVAEVRFTAYYPDWANAKSASKVSGFDPKKTWRTLKVCRPKTRGCAWDGDRQAATVSYTWNPTVGEKKRSVPGVPKADPAVSPSSKKCVPVTLGIDVVDASGTVTSAPGGKIAQRCDAKASGLARTVYLDPLAPPAAPGNVQLNCRRRERALSAGPRGRKLEACMPSSGAELTWQDRSGNEDGFNVYARLCPRSNCGDWAYGPARLRDWTRLRSFRTGVTRWEPGCTQVSHALQKADVGYLQLGVASSNRAGESVIVAAPLALTLWGSPGLADLTCVRDEWVYLGPPHQ